MTKKAINMTAQPPIREQEKKNWEFFLSIPDKIGNLGKATADEVDGVHPDPMIPKDESGHPIQHRFAKGKPKT